MDTKLQQSTNASSFRWVILFVTWFCTVAIAYNQFVISALAIQVMEQMGMAPEQFSSAIMAPMLPGVFFGILAGVMADRFGVKKIVTIGYILSIIGAISRVYASNYSQFFIFMFLLGMGAVFISANVIKLFSAWFPMEQIGIAMGVFLAAGAVGTALSQATGAMFPSLQSAFTVSGIALIVFLAAWILFIQDKPKGAPEMPAMPVVKYLNQAAKSKNVWVIGVGMMLFMGFQMTYASFLPTALASAKGISAVQAGMIASLFTLGGFAGNILGPTISSRFGAVKPVVIVMAILGGAVSYLGWIIGQTAVMSIGFIIGGFGIGACVPMLMSYPAMLPEVGPLYAGSAGGIISTMQMAGAFILPSFVITPISGGDFNIMFMLGSASGALIALTVLFLPELGRKALEARAAVA